MCSTSLGSVALLPVLNRGGFFFIIFLEEFAASILHIIKQINSLLRHSQYGLLNLHFSHHFITKYCKVIPLYLLAKLALVMSSCPFINSGGSSACCSIGVSLPLLEGLKVNLYICSIAAGKRGKKDITCSSDRKCYEGHRML